MDLKEIDEIQDFAVNSMALASSVTARVRNNTMSALAYRVSCVLFHSGVSHQDLIRLNHLGILTVSSIHFLTTAKHRKALTSCS